MSAWTLRTFEIVPMGPGHLTSVVEIHLESFPGFFLTFLGPTFLRRLYLEILRRRDHATFVAHDERGALLGFVVGVCDQGSFYGEMARHRWFRFALAATGAVLRKPSIVARLFRAFSYPKLSRSAAADALLLSLAVRPEAEGQGVGRRLVETFLIELKRRGSKSVSLTTDRDGNGRVNEFYQRAGFEVVSQYQTPEGRRMNQYVRSLG